jgi:ribulose-5-phosphate 4-epimerase/fuculose-1-phosphate aldolase
MREDAAREQLATCTRIFTMYGLIGMFGHISVFLPETRRVVICPGSGADKATARAEDMLVIDLDGRKLDGAATIPKEWPIHTELHQARPDALAVAHCHAYASTLLAIAERPLRPVTMSGAIFADGVEVYEEVEFIETLDAGRRLVAAVGDRPAILLRCHGSVCVASSIEGMLHTSFMLEDNARRLVDVQPLGNAIRTLTPEECRRVQPSYPEARARAHWAYMAAQEARWDRQPATGLGLLA